MFKKRTLSSELGEGVLDIQNWERGCYKSPLDFLKSNSPNILRFT